MRKKGFTFIELVLTIVIIGIIAGVAAQVLIRGIDAYSLITNRKDALQHARVGMDRMVLELMLIRSTDLTYISNTRINFFDAQGYSTNFRQATVSSYPELYRGDDFLSGRIAAFDFDFYQSNGSSTSSASSVRRINIELTVQGLGSAGTVPLRTEVFPRKFMYSNFQ